MNVTVNFQGFDLDIAVIYADEDAIDWKVFDTETDHTSLLNEILHEKYNDDIQLLIVEALGKEAIEYETEQKLSALLEEKLP